MCIYICIYSTPYMYILYTTRKTSGILARSQDKNGEGGGGGPTNYIECKESKSNNTIKIKSIEQTSTSNRNPVCNTQKQAGRVSRRETRERKAAVGGG